MASEQYCNACGQWHEMTTAGCPRGYMAPRPALTGSSWMAARIAALEAELAAARDERFELMADGDEDQREALGRIAVAIGRPLGKQNYSTPCGADSFGSYMLEVAKYVEQYVTAAREAQRAAEAIVRAAKAVRVHGSDYKHGTHAVLLWELVDASLATPPAEPAPGDGGER